MPEPVRNNAVEEFMWTRLTNEGLDLVTRDRVEQLIEFVKNNKVDRSGQHAENGVRWEGGVTPNSTSEQPQVDAVEKAMLRHILEDNSLRGLLDDDGVELLSNFLDIQVGGRGNGDGREAPGEVPKGSIPNNMSSMLNRRVKLEHAGALFTHEYDERAAELFESPALTDDQKAKNVLFLLQDYANVVNNARANGPTIVAARRDLLTAFMAKPFAAKYGAADPDDDFLASAWEIVWGTDPESPQSKFDVDKSKQWSAYMSMSGYFIPTAERIDEYLAAKGRPANCAKLESFSPVNWLVDETKGNWKRSSTFMESNAISTTGVDFAIKLLDNERSVGDKELDPTFDLKVDFYAWGNFVTLSKARGEKLVPKHDETGETLKVEIDPDYEDESHWRPRFLDKDGNVVPASDVTCVITDYRGNVKGDGKATGSYSASWWGFCDKNAMLGLVTMKYGFPKPSKDVTLKVGDKEIEFSAKDVVNIVSRRLTEIFPKNTQAGNRYDDEPDQVHLKSGKTIVGKIETPVEFYRPTAYRTGDNMVVTPESEYGPTGTVLIKLAEGETDKDIKATDIAEVRRAQQDGSSTMVGTDTVDTIVMKDGTEHTGKLETNISFVGAERLEDGTMVVKNTEANPILGDLKMKDTRGEPKRIPITDINYMVREDENEVLADEALAYIIRNRGVFCADSWTGSSVANGTRTISEIDRWRPGDTDKPSWIARGELAELKGYKGKVQNPDNLLFFKAGTGAYGGMQFWIEVDDNNMPINANIYSGQWDFLWGVEGKPNWNMPAQMNSAVPNELVLELYINSIDNPADHADVLPPNWRDYLIGPEPAAPGVIDGVEIDSEAATKMLDIVNNASRVTLDDTIGLDSRAVDAIMAARPIESIEALDACDYVESRAANKMLEYLPSWTGVDA